MKHKKASIVLILIIVLAIVGTAGFLWGRSSGADAQRTAANALAQEEATTIAVVNLDEGVTTDQTSINYGERISEFPDPDFEYSSLTEARNGFESGEYGAYIVIPATFSESVESINSTPQASFLEYAVNQTYSGKTQYELLYRVVSYANSLNDNLSYMYLNNILQEFHNAQDGATTVMANDLADKEAIDSIEAYDLVALVPVPELRQEENTTETLDITPFTERNEELSQSINDQYMSCVAQIEEELQTMQTSGTQLSDILTNLSHQVEEINLTVDAEGESIVDKADDTLKESLETYVDGAIDKDELSSQLQTIRNNNQYIKEKWNQSNSIYNGQLQGRLEEELGEALTAAAAAVPELTVTENGSGGYTVAVADSAAAGTVPSITFTLADIETASAEEALLKEIVAAVAQSGTEIPELSQFDAQVSALGSGYTSAKEFLNGYGTGQMEISDGKYIQYTGDPTAFADYAAGKVSGIDLSAYSIEQVSDYLYDDAGNIMTDNNGDPVFVSSLIDEEDQDLSDMKEAVENSSVLDIQSVQQLVKEAYVNPITANADAAEDIFTGRNEDEKEYIAQYNQLMSEFGPGIEAGFIEENIAAMTTNNTDLQTALTENNLAYMEYADRVFEAAEENVSSLEEHINETKESSDAAVTNGLSEAKAVKEAASEENQLILYDFTQKLPYTRIGSAEYTQAYQFIASPTELTDSSAENSGSAELVSAEAEQESGDFPWGIVSIAGGVLVLILLALLVFGSRKNKIEQ